MLDMTLNLEKVYPSKGDKAWTQKPAGEGGCVERPWVIHWASEFQKKVKIPSCWGAWEGYFVLVVLDLRLRKQVAILYNELVEEILGGKRVVAIFRPTILAKVGNGFEEWIDVLKQKKCYLRLCF